MRDQMILRSTTSDPTIPNNQKLLGSKYQFLMQIYVADAEHLQVIHKNIAFHDIHIELHENWIA